MTVDRLMTIHSPVPLLPYADCKLYGIIIIMWILTVFLAAFPFANIEYFENFYGRSGVCLALHITNETPNGWEYAVGIFLGEFILKIR